MRRRCIISGDFRRSSLCTSAACEPEDLGNIGFKPASVAAGFPPLRSSFIAALCRSEKPQLRSWRAPPQPPFPDADQLCIDSDPCRREPSKGCHLAARWKRRTLKSRLNRFRIGARRPCTSTGSGRTAPPSCLNTWVDFKG